MSGYTTPVSSVVSGTLTGIGQASPGFKVAKTFNFSLWGTFVGTVLLQRSFDNGVTWITVATDGTGTLASYNSPTSVSVDETEWNVLYQAYCSAYTSGTINYRLSFQVSPHLVTRV